MASLEKRGGAYRAKFRYGGKQLGCSLRTGELKEARALLGRLEDNLSLVERGRLVLPEGCDVGRFLLSDGKITQKPVLETVVTIKELFERYQARSDGNKEVNTRYTEKIQLAHLERLIGGRTNAKAVTVETLQRYVGERSEERWRGATISHRTVQKEIGTFAAVWNTWAVPQGLVSGPAPTKGLRYAKLKVKPPFQTWEQIERKVARGGLSAAEEDSLWGSLFLTVPEIGEVLKHVEGSRFAFVHPMFCFAAHTGARRSEVLRSEVDDFDFGGSVVRLREKKKDRSKDFTFRHVPLSPFLAGVMRAWFAAHPGGQLTICHEAGEPLTPAMSAHHFVWALEGSKWEKVPGFHCFRHSFASNCAARGIDQRMISEWLGHVTPEMERRYRHLFPEQQQKALGLVFG